MTKEQALQEAASRRETAEFFRSIGSDHQAEDYDRQAVEWESTATRLSSKYTSWAQMRMDIDPRSSCIEAPLTREYRNRETGGKI